MIDELLQPKPDVLAGKIQGVIDLQRYGSNKGKALEASADRLIDATYLTGEMRRLLEGLHRRLNSTDAETGLFLAEGIKGVGKSHVLLLTLHLLQAPDLFRDWLARQGIEFSVPSNLKVVWRKFTDFPLESLWGLVGDAIGADFTGPTPPDLPAFQRAIEGRKLVLIFDELESGVRSIANDALRQQNINFLQMLAEESCREHSNVALLCSIYDGNQEPGLTLKRGQRVEVRFADPKERRRILFHRLFGTSPTDANPQIEAIVQSFLNTWRRFGVEVPDHYAEMLRDSYPFSPELLDFVLIRIPQLQGGFQGTRGTLGFLAALVKARSRAANLITLADASLGNAELRSWLADLNPSQSLIQCAESNLTELRRYPFADRIASSVLLASLAPSPKQKGISEAELARQVVAPDSEFNEFHGTLKAFAYFGSYFHQKGDDLFFDVRENAHAKVRLRAVSIGDAEAWERVVEWWKIDVLKDGDAVFVEDVALANSSLAGRSGDDLKLVVAPRRLKNEERHKLYFGLRWQNTVLLLEPKDDRTNLRANEDLLEYAKRSKAAELLAAGADEAPRRNEFLQIAGEEKKLGLDRLRKENLVYVQIARFASNPADCEFLLEGLPSAASKQQIQDHLLQTVYPPALLEEHLRDRKDELIGKTVAQVEADYKRALGFPVLLYQSVFRDAIFALVEDGTAFGICPPGRQAVCGNRPSLHTDEFFNAEIVTAFQDRPTETAYPSPRPGRPPLDSGRPSDGVPTGSDFPGSFGGSEFPEGGLPPIPVSEQLSTTFETSRQAIRQKIAGLLDGQEGRLISRIRIEITYDARETDIGDLPKLLRGTLSGMGTFNGEAVIEFTGAYEKSEVEEMMERLPEFTPGSCRVRLTLAKLANV